MRKKLIFIILLFLLPYCIFAKGAPKRQNKVKSKTSSKQKFCLGVAGGYTRFTNCGSEKTGQVSESILNSANLGGATVDFSYNIKPNFGLYSGINFAFGRPFTHIMKTRYRSVDMRIIDTSNRKMSSKLVYAVNGDLGLFYAWDIAKNMQLNFGGGFAIGGAGLSRTGKVAGVTTLDKYSLLNVGAALSFNFIYMFNKTVGLSVGVSDSLYGTVLLKFKRSSATHGNEAFSYSSRDDMWQESVGTFSNSFNLNCGLKFKF